MTKDERLARAKAAQEEKRRERELADASIETTRIYLRKTATEQREIVDRVITW